MKRNQFTLTALLASLLVVILFVQCDQPATTNAAPVAASTTVHSGSSLPVAFVNVDSLLVNYAYAIFLNEEVLKKQEDARADLGEEQRVLQKEGAEFQRKLENNGFLSRDRAEKEQLRLQKKAMELENLGAKLGGEIAEKQQTMQQQLLDSITNILVVYNKDHNYEMILSNTTGGNVLFAKEKYNITEDVLDLLNSRYKK